MCASSNGSSENGKAVFGSPGVLWIWGEMLFIFRMLGPSFRLILKKSPASRGGGGGGGGLDCTI